MVASSRSWAPSGIGEENTPSMVVLWRALHVAIVDRYRGSRGDRCRPVGTSGRDTITHPGCCTGTYCAATGIAVAPATRLTFIHACTWTPALRARPTRSARGSNEAGC